MLFIMTNFILYLIIFTGLREHFILFYLYLINEVFRPELYEIHEVFCPQLYGSKHR